MQQAPKKQEEEYESALSPSEVLLGEMDAVDLSLKWKVSTSSDCSTRQSTGGSTPPLLQSTGDCKSERSLGALGTLGETTGTEQVFQALQREKRLAVLVADPELKDLPVLCCSEGFEALTGFNAESEVLGEPCLGLGHALSDLSCPEESPPVLSCPEECQVALAQGLDWAGLFPKMRKDGSTWMCLVCFTTCFINEKIYIIAVHADVTEDNIQLATSTCMSEAHDLCSYITEATIKAWLQTQWDVFPFGA
ncbi:unnamed protein product [Polarella glacialis]|uniref:PAS domain-containing protein n=1 Tax=Polarella glacialis TaxID=89957 RepID=A0A813KW32_POLGL|nr:unnamed protein product [Polarella glacialis]